MLGLETPSTCPETEPNLQLLVKLEQEKKPWRRSYFAEVDSRVAALELESCITHASESHSPDKSETKDHHYQLSTSCPEVASSACNLESNSPGSYSTRKSCPASMWAGNETEQLLKSPTIRDKKKRKRTKPCKNSEEVESQRMTHIAVERNRRKMMNDHLNALRSLMPSSFVQRGDQASIIGGAIDFVKELEQLLQSLQAQKRHRQTEEEEGYKLDSSSPFDGFFSSPQYSAFSASQIESGEHTAANRSVVANIEVTVIQAHVNLKILSPRRRGQLLKAITALEDLSLTILHLNVTSLDQSVLYSFNLKIEEECKLGSADKIATAVYQIFSYINGN